ncbi:MAG: hypothetical protein NT034_04185 [Candidatus Magasanikbacteria bacterium]|nr:hypothetical protein [Candidatus Magasanikbacteria bacterium]
MNDTKRWMKANYDYQFGIHFIDHEEDDNCEFCQCIPLDVTCSECNWTNVGLWNLGESGKPRWVCQGCAKRSVDKTKGTPVESHLANGIEEGRCEQPERTPEERHLKEEERFALMACRRVNGEPGLCGTIERLCRELNSKETARQIAQDNYDIISLECSEQRKINNTLNKECVQLNTEVADTRLRLNTVCDAARRLLFGISRGGDTKMGAEDNMRDVLAIINILTKKTTI